MSNQPYDLNSLTLPSIYGGASSANAYGDAFKNVASSRAPSILDSPAFAQIRDLLAPSTGGQLSPNLKSLLDLGNNNIDRNFSRDKASALTTTLGRGFEDSSIGGYEVGHAQDVQGQSRNALLANILGIQHGDSGTLANYLFSGTGQQLNDEHAQLMSLLQFLQGGQESSANIGMFRDNMANANNLADQRNSTDQLSAILGLIGNVGGGAAKGYFSK